MDLGLDPLGDDHNIIDTVEVDHHQTVNPSLLSFDGTADIRRSLTPGSSILPSRTHNESHGYDASLLGHRLSRDFVHNQPSSPPLPFAPLPTNAQPLPFSAVVIPPPKYQPLPYSTSRTGLAFDVRMLLHQHLTGSHPENPRRIYEIYLELQAGGLVPLGNEPTNDYHLLRLPSQPATVPEIGLVHTAEYIDFVRSLGSLDTAELAALTTEKEDADSIYFHPDTWLSATLAAGGAIEATRAVVAGNVKNAIAVIRPPGHHAEHNKACGFCFFNNVCVAAKVVQKEYPELCRKVLILDWDVHHGNGVQQAFEDDPNVLYISLHVHMDGRYYPEGDYGDHLHCGKGLGLGRNVNIPWPTKGMGDAEYLYAFQQLVMPIGLEFDPDLVIISAGFDAAEGDLLGGCFVSPAGYSHMTHMLMQLAKGKVVACLEGGYGFAVGNPEDGLYDPRPIAKSALAVARTLVGETPERLGDLTVQSSAVDIVRTVIRVQSKFWKCLYPKDLNIQRKKELGSERLHDIIREWQSKTLWEKYRMSTLWVLRQNLSKSFDNQILATPNYQEARPILIIFHDPPEALGIPNPRTNNLELHNTWLTDVSKTYIDWAVNHDFAVIDVNCPKHITSTEDDTGYEDADKVAQRAAATRDVAQYLWRNYIETGDSTHIFLLGIGDAYIGIIKLLNEHSTAAERVTHTFAFIAENTLSKVDRPGDDGQFFANHFHQHSTIIVSHTHPAFDLPRKKLSRKFGKVFASTQSTLQDMLLDSREQVTETLLGLTAGWRQRTAAVGTAADTEDELGIGGANGGVNGDVGANGEEVVLGGGDAMDELSSNANVGTGNDGTPLDAFLSFRGY